MKDYYDTPDDMPDGYRETITQGMYAIRSISRRTTRGTGTKKENIARLKEEIEQADAVVIGAGAGLSTSAGLEYGGERFLKYFSDFAEKYGITDMYSGGFYPFPDDETRWAWWARHICFNRYTDAPKPVYKDLLKLVKDKDYFVITTNVDHKFQQAGFDKERLFYTQGDYGVFQSVDSSNRNTFDNREWVEKAMEAEGYVKNADGEFELPEGVTPKMRLPSDLIPKCPDDGSDVKMNLRGDDTFVENDGWRKASAAYADYLKAHEGLRVLHLELGIGGNTPVIVKYPFWYMTMANPNAVYACLNYGEAFAPVEIGDRSICINGDIGEVLEKLTEKEDIR